MASRRRRAAKYVKRQALSINIAKWAGVGYTAGKVLSGVNLSSGLGAFTQMGENFKQNWKDIAMLNVGIALLGLMLGRYAPRAGIKGALSVKAF